MEPGRPGRQADGCYGRGFCRTAIWLPTTSLLDVAAARDRGAGPFRGAIQKWRHLAGAIGADGQPVEMPEELRVARFVDMLCRRYSCLPSQVLAEDVGLLRMMAVLAEAEGESRPVNDEARLNLAALSRNL